MSKKVHILTYTTLYPNNIFPTQALFIRERIVRLAQHFSITVVAPVPFFPPLPIHKKWFRYSLIKKRESRDTIQIYHPRFFTLPKIGMQWYGYLMAFDTFNLVRNLHHTHHFDLIDAHYMYPDGFAASHIAQKLNIPLCITGRGTDINLFTTFPKIRKHIISASAKAKTVITVSQSLKKVLCDLAIPSHKIQVITNGVNRTIFKPSPISESKKSLPIPAHRPLLLSIGNLYKAKGFHLLINSLHLIKKEKLFTPTPYLVIIGDGDYHKELHTLIAHYDMHDDIAIHSAIPQSSLSVWYNACDLFCLLSFREGIPNVIREAFSCGKPVVASSVGGIPEIVTSTDLGLLCHSFSLDDITSKLIEGLNKKWERTLIQNHAQTFNWDTVINQTRAVFESVIGE